MAKNKSVRMNTEKIEEAREPLGSNVTEIVIESNANRIHPEEAAVLPQPHPRESFKTNVKLSAKDVGIQDL